MADLDEFDLRIVRLMQENSRRTGEALAELVGLSPAACLRRVQRLRKNGVIQKEVAVISPKVLGNNITLVASVTMRGAKTSEDDIFTRRMKRLPEVINCQHVTGNADYILTVQLPDMEAYKYFCEAHFYQPEVKRYDTAVVIDTVK